MDPASQADDLALEEESPSLWSPFYRSDVNVDANGRQKFAWCTQCHDLDKSPLTFVTHCSLQNQVCAGRLVDGLHTLGST
jgi:hypothetical protein